MSEILQRLKAIPYLPILIGLTVLRLITASVSGLVPDEAYYWLWAQHPSAGYYDHPPMVAWWITVSTAIFGHSPFSVRLPFVLSFLALSWLMFDAARALFSDTIARRTLLWLNACLLLSIGSVIATPDPPSVLMWGAGLWALARLIASGQGYWWLVFGAFAGLGVEAKYTNLFLGVGVALWVAINRDARRWLLTPWPYLGGVAALIAMAPNLAWNATHDFATLGKQFGRMEAGQFTLSYLIEFLLSQPLLLNPLICAFAAIGAVAWWRDRSDARLALLIALPLPLIVYMLTHVFHDRIQGNWPAPIFPGLVLLAAYAAETHWPRLRSWTAPFGIAITVIVLMVLSLSGVVKLPGAAGLSQGWEKVANAVRQHHSGAAFIATTDYNTQGELSFHLRDLSVIGMVERERYTWPTSDAAGQTALIIVQARRSINLDVCFEDVRELAIISRLEKPNPKSDFRLYSGRLKAARCDLTEN
ncbi:MULTISPECIES: glycosyltransferase family 39 protein [Asticcacaulis]|uniref:ArnT family glycosyltransferase n=1 Tax=Asticcacaulis TaxID=76890 RepID=UPI00285A462C|nr:glycosyltransferase family 39 protein [Asticcacaulis sp. BE141]MBP2161687.1 4-amino-4-deoxy-L-arabinose transferase-like glycosyltransferase [Asticcacaulis solisilvae]MDR6802688.1 4-amino-4-deoxy-L-arabinose transferase-like glycosyltransferase [Asticcacaulis sp. BE141]